ncbi:hypothetical protein [Lentzea fradiae]|uniref:hypothetical protein n=1 Tax=Lentzea fradiae TaxID=200378 RepID=UPI000B7F8C4F|nr:hypothetical protein [Lentzea fradiae]
MTFTPLPLRLDDVCDDVCLAFSRAVRGIVGTEWRPRNVGTTATILVTSRQWDAVLEDADLAGHIRQLTEAVARVVDVRTCGKRAIGSRLKRLLASLQAADDAVRSAVAEVAWFVPPDSEASAVRAVRTIATLLDRGVAALVRSLANEIEPESWSVARDSFRRMELWIWLLSERPAPAAMSVFERVLNLPAGLFDTSRGLSWTSALFSEWAVRGDELDSRLRAQLPHLLESSGELTDKLRMHLTQLLCSPRPFLAQRAAVAARDLVRRALNNDHDKCLDAIASTARRNPELESSHRRFLKAFNEFNGAATAQDAALAAGRLYHVVAEGYLCKVGRVAVRLLGKPADGSMLTKLSQQFGSMSHEPVCAMLNPFMKPKWRNAVAHEHVWWDSVMEKVHFGAEVEDPELVVDIAVGAREICQAFETGVAVAMWEAGHPNQLIDTSNEVSSTQLAMQTLGRCGIMVTDYQRAGAVVMFRVPTISIETLGRLLSALVATSIHLDAVERWIVRQDDVAMPDLVVPGEAVSATLECLEVGSDGGKVIDTGISWLPLIVTALRACDTESEVIVNAIVALASSQVLGEHQRLRSELVVGDVGATQEFAGMMLRLERIMRAVIDLAQPEVQPMLRSYLQLVSRVRVTFVLNPKLVEHPVYRELLIALRSATPAKFPWIRN